jgi:CheY-like chemotaxis protein
LIDNALKFTPKGKVRFGFQSNSDGIACFVEDTGIGIDKRMQQQVFDFFVQENQENTRGHEGSGLGLSIVKGLTEILGGQLEIHSEKQKGTKIEVFLPAEKQDVQKPISKNAAVMQQTEGKQKMVLIAEDEDTNFFVLDLFVRKSLNLGTIRARNGIEAIEAFKQNPEIILVLMDIKMPVMDGIEATRKIKTLNPDMPVIAITAYALSGDEHKLRMAGCDDYIAKPVQKKELLRKIDKILGNN